MNGHADESPELYALGSLDETERTQIEAHAAACEACAARLREAQAAVAAMVQLEPLHPAPAALGERLAASLGPRWPSTPRAWQPAMIALAAAFVIAVAPLSYVLHENRSMHDTMQQDDRALARIAASPFARSSFVPRDGGSARAKVLYAKDGSWYYVIVSHPDPAMQVAYVHDGRMEMLGSLRMRGEMGTLYLPVRHKMDQLAIVERGTVLADAHLAY